MTKATLKERDGLVDLLSPIEEGKTAQLPATRQRQKVATKDDTLPVNMLAIIARAAADPAVQPEKMRALLDMQKEIAAEEARIAFTEAFIALQQDLPTINATGRIEIREKIGGERTGKVQQSTPYAKFNEINKIIKPLLQKHGFSLSFATEPSPDGLRIIVKGMLDHKRGYGRSTSFPLPAETSGSKNNVQGWGSSMSYGKRYCAIALLNIVSEAKEDEDSNGAIAQQDRPGLTMDQSIALIALIKDSGVGLEKFLGKYQLKAVIDLDPALLTEASKACRDYAAAAAKPKKTEERF